MIIKENGHWRSIVTPDDEEKVLNDILNDASLSAQEREAVEALLVDMMDGSTANILDEAAEDQWEEVPLPIEKWINDDHYIGDIKDALYPKVKEDIISLFNGSYHECILTGCIDQDALVTCEDGSMPRLGDLIDKKTRVTTLDPVDGVEHHYTDPGVDSGILNVLHLKLANGMDVKLTPDHKVYTDRGWVPAEELIVGVDRVVVPRKLNYKPSCFDLTDDEVKLMAYWVTDGSSSDTRARYCDGRIKTAREVIKSLKALGFNSTTEEPYTKGNSWEVHVAKLKRSGFADWMTKRGIFKMGTDDAKIPDDICRAPPDQIKLFINRVWAAEGTVFYRESGPGRFQLGMKSKTFIRQMQLILLRFGILSNVYQTNGTRSGTPWTVWTLQVSGKDNVELFHREIGDIYSKELETKNLMARFKDTVANTNLDVVGFSYGDGKELLSQEGIVTWNTEWKRLYNKDRFFSRNMFDRFCEEFKEVESVCAVAEKFSPEITYSRVKSVEEVQQPLAVADIGVPGPHRFLANGINVHNSIGW